jgi:hypothetical protein
LHTYCARRVRIASRSGWDRSGTTYRSARRPRVRLLIFLLSSPLASRLSPLPSPSLSTRPHRRKITANKSLSVPLSQPPAFPFSLYLLFSFSSTLGNEDRLLAAAARHQYAPEHSLIDFSPFLLTFLLLSTTFFPERSAQRRRVHLPVPDTDTITTRCDYQV